MIKQFKNIFSEWNIKDYLILCSCIVMFSPTFYRLITLGWKSADYLHAYFILPISLGLIWSKRKALIKTQGFNVTGSLIFGSGILIYLFSVLNAFMFLEAIAFVVIMWGVFSLRFDKKSMRALLFPLSYLIFLIPPPSIAIDMATFPLKKISAHGSYMVLSLLKFPVELYGVVLRVGQNELFIADACSGFRSIVTLLSLGAVYAYFQRTTLMRKWMIFLSIFPIGITGNILRICITGILAHYFGIQFAEGFSHEFSGLVLFIFTVLGLMAATELICKVKK